MKRMFRTVLALVVTILQPPLAEAGSVARSLGAERYNFPVPEGQCFLEDDNAGDAWFIERMKTLLKSGNTTLLALTAKCAARDALRSGFRGAIFDYAAYYAPNMALTNSLPGETQSLRKSVCSDIRKMRDVTPGDLKDVVEKSARDLQANIAVTNTKDLGVVDEDEHGCYSSVLIGMRSGEKSTLTSSVVMSTVLRGKPVFLGVWSKYEGPETTIAGLQTLKAAALELDRQNP
jgi:hypothetical protein